ncbi:hypothetical protein HDU97_000748 [Phlyctochytrium planicorne]|nr:hypothetical protein HDU97_000748 [Phlyctochytrium planicorne]
MPLSMLDSSPVVVMPFGAPLTTHLDPSDRNFRDRPPPEYSLANAFQKPSSSLSNPDHVRSSMDEEFATGSGSRKERSVVNEDDDALRMIKSLQMDLQISEDGTEILHASQGLREDQSNQNTSFATPATAVTPAPTPEQALNNNISSTLDANDLRSKLVDLVDPSMPTNSSISTPPRPDQNPNPLTPQSEDGSSSGGSSSAQRGNVTPPHMPRVKVAGVVWPPEVISPPPSASIPVMSDLRAPAPPTDKASGEGILDANNDGSSSEALAGKDDSGSDSFIVLDASMEPLKAPVRVSSKSARAEKALSQVLEGLNLPNVERARASAEAIALTPNLRPTPPPTMPLPQVPVDGSVVRPPPTAPLPKPPADFKALSTPPSGPLPKVPSANHPQEFKMISPPLSPSQKDSKDQFSAQAQQDNLSPSIDSAFNTLDNLLNELDAPQQQSLARVQQASALLASRDDRSPTINSAFNQLDNLLNELDGREPEREQSYEGGGDLSPTVNKAFGQMDSLLNALGGGKDVVPKAIPPVQYQEQAAPTISNALNQLDHLLSDLGGGAAQNMPSIREAVAVNDYPSPPKTAPPRAPLPKPPPQSALPDVPPNIERSSSDTSLKASLLRSNPPTAPLPAIPTSKTPSFDGAIPLFHSEISPPIPQHQWVQPGVPVSRDLNRPPQPGGPDSNVAPGPNVHFQQYLQMQVSQQPRAPTPTEPGPTSGQRVTPDLVVSGPRGSTPPPMIGYRSSSAPGPVGLSPAMAVSRDMPQSSPKNSNRLSHQSTDSVGSAASSGKKKQSAASKALKVMGVSDEGELSKAPTTADHKSVLRSVEPEQLTGDDLIAALVTGKRPNTGNSLPMLRDLEQFTYCGDFKKKKERGLGGWKKRYGVLMDGMLYVFVHNDPFERPTEMLAINSTTTVNITHYSSYTIQITTIGVTPWTIQLESEDEMKSWERLIRQGVALAARRLKASMPNALAASPPSKPEVVDEEPVQAPLPTKSEGRRVEIVKNTHPVPMPVPAPVPAPQFSVAPPPSVAANVVDPVLQQRQLYLQQQMNILQQQMQQLSAATSAMATGNNQWNQQQQPPMMSPPIPAYNIGGRDIASGNRSQSTPASSFKQPQPAPSAVSPPQRQPVVSAEQQHQLDLEMQLNALGLISARPATSKPISMGQPMSGNSSVSYSGVQIGQPRNLASPTPPQNRLATGRPSIDGPDMLHMMAPKPKIDVNPRSKMTPRRPADGGYQPPPQQQQQQPQIGSGHRLSRSRSFGSSLNSFNPNNPTTPSSAASSASPQMTPVGSPPSPLGMSRQKLQNSPNYRTFQNPYAQLHTQQQQGFVTNPTVASGSYGGQGSLLERSGSMLSASSGASTSVGSSYSSRSVRLPHFPQDGPRYQQASGNAMTAQQSLQLLLEQQLQQPQSVSPPQQQQPPFQQVGQQFFQQQILRQQMVFPREQPSGGNVKSNDDVTIEGALSMLDDLERRMGGHGVNR